MEWRRFLAWNAAGGVVWATIFGLLGYFGQEAFERLSPPINIALGTRAIWFAHVLGLPLVVVLVGWTRARSMLLALVVSAAVGGVLYYLLFIGAPSWFGLDAALPARGDQISIVSPLRAIDCGGFIELLRH